MLTFESRSVLFLSQECSSLAVEVLQKPTNKAWQLLTRVALLGGGGTLMK